LFFFSCRSEETLGKIKTEKRARVSGLSFSDLDIFLSKNVKIHLPQIEISRYLLPISPSQKQKIHHIHKNCIKLPCLVQVTLGKRASYRDFPFHKQCDPLADFSTQMLLTLLCTLRPILGFSRSQAQQTLSLRTNKGDFPLRKRSLSVKTPMEI
jgi:hypothetical protein